MADVFTHKMSLFALEGDFHEREIASQSKSTGRLAKKSLNIRSEMFPDGRGYMTSYVVRAYTRKEAANEDENIVLATSSLPDAIMAYNEIRD